MNSQRLRDYALLMRMDKPIGSALLLWPTLWALWLAADGPPTPWVGFVFVAGVFLMRSAGCVINDLADRDIDPHVDRTRDRPLAAGRVTVREALWLFAALTLVAFALVLTMNTLTVALSFAGIALAMTYPLMKRFTHLPQAYLGVAFGWGIPHGFCRGDWHGNANGMVSAGDQYSVGHRLRHDVCDVGPRRRFAHRRKVIGNFVRPR